MAVILPTGRDYTIDDLSRFPDDSNRYELIEGSLHVTPSPVRLHQRVSASLFLLLDAACPPDLEVFYAPVDVVLGPATLLIPDLIVVPVADEESMRIESPPLLAVEVLSPSTRLYDLGTKWGVYEESGVGASWIVDPRAPSVHAWTWADGRAQEQEVTGDDELALEWPFPVRVRPSDLVRRR